MSDHDDTEPVRKPRYAFHAPTQASDSWWIAHARDGFTACAERQQSRMRNNREYEWVESRSLARWVPPYPGKAKDSSKVIVGLTQLTENEVER